MSYYIPTKGSLTFCEELYLQAFGALRSVFTHQELNGLAELMAERGLRMRKDLQDYLENWEAVEEIEKDDSDVDEIEASAREYRRLLPY